MILLKRTAHITQKQRFASNPPSGRPKGGLQAILTEFDSN
jgi:hypothetical protein